jgi:transposase-like protein
VTEVIQLLLRLDQEAFLRENGGRKNGHYRRSLQTRFGQVDLSIPRADLTAILHKAPGT